MKKYIIGAAVIVVLIGYSFEVRNERPTLSAPQNDTNSSTPPTTAGKYKDGTYTGSVENAYYGDLQVSTKITNGNIVDVTFNKYPDTHSTSVFINKQAVPLLKQEAIKAQSANVDVISGATYTSDAFNKSLNSALSQAS